MRWRRGGLCFTAEKGGKKVGAKLAFVMVAAFVAALE
jgi:hypothetical protein